METDIREKINTLIKRQYRCVLATSSENRPLCSLMAYASNASCNEIYLMTLKNSRKYHNMCENPAVSILIDTRQDTPGLGQNETMALTLSGHFDRNIDDTERGRILKELARRHPELKEFFETPEMEPVKIIVTSCLLMEGPAKAHHMEFSDL